MQNCLLFASFLLIFYGFSIDILLIIHISPIHGRYYQFLADFLTDQLSVTHISLPMAHMPAQMAGPSGIRNGPIKYYPIWLRNWSPFYKPRRPTKTPRFWHWGFPFHRRFTLLRLLPSTHSGTFRRSVPRRSLCPRHRCLLREGFLFLFLQSIAGIDT